MPLSAVDAIGPAFQHAKVQLIRPFRLAQWGKLALVGLLAGELGSGGGCNFSGFDVPIPHRTGGSNHFFPSLPSFPSVSPEVLVAAIAALVVAGLLLGILFLYLNSMMRFVLFDSILEKRCQIQRSWGRRTAPGFRYFVWQIVFGLAMLAGMAIFIGIPAAIGLALGWFKDPDQHLAPLILAGILFFFIGFAFVIVALLTEVLTKDFVVPQMAMENISAFEGWRRLLRMLDAEKGSYAGYIGMKIVMALGAAVLVGIVAGIAVLVLLIPIGGFGAVAVLIGHAAGMTWNLYTITMAVVVGSIAVCLVLYVTSLISVPVIVFFPAYSIYFFASRYPALAAVLYPMPAPPAPPTPPPLPPSPATIG